MYILRPCEYPIRHCAISYSALYYYFFCESHGGYSSKIVQLETDVEVTVSKFHWAPSKFFSLRFPLLICVTWSAYTQTKYITLTHLTSPNSDSIFTTSELLPTLLKYDISDGESTHWTAWRWCPGLDKLGRLTRSRFDFWGVRHFLTLYHLLVDGDPRKADVRWK